MLSLTSGAISLESLKSSGHMTLVHGGESPGEPTSSEAIIKGQALLAALGAIAVEQDFPIDSVRLAGITPTFAEKATLLAAAELEADPLFNAGRGSKLQGDGVARVSAGFMESTRRKLSSVVNVSGILHPSYLAYILQGRRYPMLDGVGATKLAHEIGMNAEDLTIPRTVQLRDEQRAQDKAGERGTIGSVSIDSETNLAVVTSTGGVGNETVGRIGDTPTIAGTYCGERVGISCTGIGEQIVNQAFAARVAVRVEDGMELKAAMERSIQEASALGHIVDAIAISRSGPSVNWAAGGTEPYFAWAAQTPSGTLSFTD